MKKRLAKKQQRKQLEKKVSQSLSKKEVKRLSFADLQRQNNAIIQREKKRAQEEKRRQEKYRKAQELLDYKRESLRALGFDEKFLKTSYLRKIKKSDIEAYKKGNEYALSVESYPFLYDSYGLDYNKIYTFPDGKGLYIAWQDYTGESTFEEILVRFNGLSNETLINILEGIVRQPPTYNKKAPNHGAGTSSGRAGTVRHAVCTNHVAKQMFKADNSKIGKAKKNEKKKRVHTGATGYFQTLTDGDNYIIRELTARECLVILNAVMYNITEESRVTYYNGLYTNITKYIPDFKKILPKP